MDFCPYISYQPKNNSNVDEEISFSCRQCFKSFKEPRFLILHISTEHNSDSNTKSKKNNENQRNNQKNHKNQQNQKDKKKGHKNEKNHKNNYKIQKKKEQSSNIKSISKQKVTKNTNIVHKKNKQELFWEIIDEID